jgi:RNA polymerase sigma-70 factor (ECF subfamily)
MLQKDKKINFTYKDEELIKEFQKGNEYAYLELVNRYKDKLMNFIVYYVGERDLAEDIVQETIIKLYEKKNYYKEIARFSTWIYTIARNQANTELRKKKRRNITFLSQMNKDSKDFEVDSKAPDLIQELQDDYLGKRIQSAIKSLPEHLRIVITLRDIQNLSYDEISRIVEVPLGTVKSRINRARIQLQAELKDLKEF